MQEDIYTKKPKKSWENSLCEGEKKLDLQHGASPVCGSVYSKLKKLRKLGVVRVKSEANERRTCQDRRFYYRLVINKHITNVCLLFIIRGKARAKEKKKR
jgi:hypothetical protein